MLLARVVETSRRIAETSKRLEKIDLLAGLLRQLHDEEIEIVVSFLSARTRQGRMGIGYATIRDSTGSPADAASLEIIEVDRTFQAIAATEGRGSAGQRLDLLHGLFARVTQPEQQFLASLLVGELRQGALEGIMLEGLAKASGFPVERVRRAVMVAGDIAMVARAVLEKGEAGLAQYDV